MPAAEGAVPTASSCAPRPPRGGTGCRTLFTPVKGPGWGLARMKRLASVCSRVTLLTSAGRMPASSRHTVLFSLILGGVGGRCMSREALQTRAGVGGSVAAHRERAAHGTHPTPGLPHGHAASSLRRPAPVSGPSALPAPRGSFFPVQPPQSQRPRPRRSREPRALGLARALTGSRVIRVKVSAGGACVKPGLPHPIDFHFYHLTPSEHGREFRGRGRT